MQTKDLMIGDWVVVDNTPGFADSKNELFYHYYDVLQPVRLSVEILQQNKFCDKYGVVCGVNCPEDKDCLLEISVGRNECAYWTINWNEYKILKLQYVHELQHALRLCGIEKNINL